MNKNVAFTICTASYVGLAKTMKTSFLKYNDFFDFFVFVVDYKVNYDLPNDVCDIRNFVDLTDDEYTVLTFKYNVTEFCTALKPYCFKTLLKKYENLVLYFDPDILFYSKFDEVQNSTANIFLTPHRVCLNPVSCEISYEKDILQSGIYNCGFVGMRKSNIAISVSEWWITRLKDYCYFDPNRGLFTDQKWMDYIPAFVSTKDLYIIKNLGCNFAPWNYLERKCVSENDVYYIESRFNFNGKDKLCFMHYSGYNYANMLNGDFSHKTTKRVNYDDIKTLLIIYANELKKENVEKYFKYKYCYNNYDNGDVILSIHRKLFPFAIEKISEKNPFVTKEGSYYKLLKKSRLVTKNKKAVADFNSYNMKGISTKKRILERFFTVVLKFCGVSFFMSLLKMFDYFADSKKHGYLLK